LIPDLNYLYFRKRAAKFVEICDTYRSQMAIKVPLSIINSAKLHCSCDGFHFGVTFWGHKVLQHVFNGQCPGQSGWAGAKMSIHLLQQEMLESAVITARTYSVQN